MIRRRTLLKRSTKPIPRKRAKPRRGPMRDPGYLQFLREEGKCIACLQALRELDALGFTADKWNRQPPSKIIDPAHGPVNGMRSKGPDNEASPLCRYHHDIQTATGWPAFESKYHVDRALEAAVWYKAYTIWKEAQS